MRHYLLLLFIGFTLCLTSCREDFHFEPSNGGLVFSRDTVYLDTVFTNIGSSTYTLKVYNRSNKDIKIPAIQLGQKENSKYRLMVDGVPGKVFNNVELLAKDSMFVFIETTIDYNEYANNKTDFLYTDNIEFTSTSGVQKVELVTLVQDAIFLFPRRDEEGNYESVPISETDNTQIYGFNLSHDEHGDEFTWTKTKPYVIYGMATVPTGETLTVEPGARVHFHADSGLMVRPGASLKIGNETDAPTEANQVIFEGDRLEPEFSETPGQWSTIWLRPGSKGHNLNNLIIKNAVVGILSEGNDGTNKTLKLRNVQIYNSANVGILARLSNIYGENVVINNAGQASLACTLGGKYEFRHCTIANYSNSYNQVGLLIADSPDAATTTEFDNCIIYGSGSYGFLFDRKSTQPLNYVFNNCLIKFSDFSNQFKTNPLYQFETDTEHYNSCYIAKNSNQFAPQFLDPKKNKLNIGTESEAIGKANPAYLVPFDILGNSRTVKPDLGAYVNHEFPKED